MFKYLKDYPYFSEALPSLKEDPKTWEGLSSLQIHFLKKLLAYDPKDRPTMHEVRNLALRCFPNLQQKETRRLQRVYSSYYDIPPFKGISVTSISGWKKAIRSIIYQGNFLIPFYSIGKVEQAHSQSYQI